ncbi:hypothetical protein BGZ51_004789 [Haplosporangium sp. Z 767]|nr:hypothetical protein BGZ51_004789 [Haplosporangium sp. Z 767]
MTVEQEQQKSKSLALLIPTLNLGPNGVPLVIGALDAPAKIAGVVVFQANYDCKGDYITIDYKAQADVHWTKRTGDRNNRYFGQYIFDECQLTMDLSSSKPGMVLAGEYACAFEFPIHPRKMPSSSIGKNGSVTYKVRATLHRGFPSTNIVQEQIVWVMNSRLPPPDKLLLESPVNMKQFKAKFLDKVPYVCTIPSDVLFLGQQVPITIKVQATEHRVQVVRAVIQLREYTTLIIKSDRKHDSKDILNIELNDGWPQAEAHQSWKRSIVVPFPGAPQLTPTLKSSIIEKSHKLKLIMAVKMDSNGTKELKVEMPVIITCPRPPGEPYPMFDLARYLDAVSSI